MAAACSAGDGDAATTADRSTGASTGPGVTAGDDGDDGDTTTPSTSPAATSETNPWMSTADSIVQVPSPSSSRNSRPTFA